MGIHHRAAIGFGFYTQCHRKLYTVGGMVIFGKSPWPRWRGSRGRKKRRGEAALGALQSLRQEKMASL